MYLGDQRDRMGRGTRSAPRHAALPPEDAMLHAISGISPVYIQRQVHTYIALISDLWQADDRTHATSASPNETVYALEYAGGQPVVSPAATLQGFCTVRNLCALYVVCGCVAYVVIIR